MLRVLLLSLLGLTLSLADEPRYHCYSPPELTFKASQYNHVFTTFNTFRGQYDVRNMRIALHEEQYEGPQPGKQYLWFIFLHHENVGYEYNEKTKECKKFAPGKFYPYGVPENAKLEAEFFVGGPGEAVDAVEWSDRTDFKREEWIGVFSRKKCYPLRTVLMNNKDYHTITTNVYDTVEGLMDPYMFMPPLECRKLSEFVPISDRARQLRSLFTRTLE